MNNIFLMPFDQLIQNNVSLDDFDVSPINVTELTKNREYLFFSSGKKSIHYLMEKYCLNRDDEVWINTTTDCSFVSSCVTSTIFNYSKVSRVLTDRTKMIFIIHEFGFPYSGIDRLIKIGKERNIPVVSDICHSLDSYINGRRVGLLGNYAIYSLPKIFPTELGGILVGDGLPKSNSNYDFEIGIRIEKIFKKYHKYSQAFSLKRRNNYELWDQYFNSYENIYDYRDSVTPFVYGFYSKKYKKVYENFDNSSSKLELNRTHVKDKISMPCNQFISHSQIHHFSKKIMTLLS